MAPLYLSLSWVLTVSYQLFTETAVQSVVGWINLWQPTAASWLIANMGTLVFVYAFTWVFVLSSVIPSLILGKERSILAQYIVVLTLSLIAFFMADFLRFLGVIDINSIFAVAVFLKNPVVAVFYLSLPYLVMIALDVRSRRKNKKLAKTAIHLSEASIINETSPVNQ
jgi:hypothetical protein